ncbi:[protein release factor]-glutamine N5-methyltransferase [Aliiroseovarius halocynthiae]|uniref:Release factor glutamine methyltransferase n=1 Tax=Aliiroseovarius halocynthiae TaxID=985055 RepID=A0A545SWJ9_9RHOB|nr:peptide chain release factor N(5)-glutamine methyltransferase [Aliiroseovarius halocynthiae]TQV69339.1 peptide chain release factor N(5)-glutamine methyltransferase [Aliiroseovarius halocynthiae]SMR72238.1 [protein release factor]-glutamine N5-methyltransferase [Aliiroseovarius halocynthiae]
MTTGSVLLAGAVPRLRQAGIEDPARDARILLAHALDVDRSRLTMVLHDDVTADQTCAFERAIEARLNRQPVAQIVGQRAFYGREFIVTPDVLDPRPDTELLVDLALSGPFRSVLDLGTGSGCILLSLLAECPGAVGQGVDVSDKAVSVAKRNAMQLGVQDRVVFHTGSWFGPLGDEAQFDLIVSNPPYITQDEMGDLSPEVREWEPHMALTPGGDGLDAYRQIARNAPDHLVQGGRLLLEIGYLQGQAVSELCRSAGFRDVSVHQDLAGKDRVVAAAGFSGP